MESRFSTQRTSVPHYEKLSIIPNLIPLLLTAAIMGFVGIPLKPSTILVFSIAFGISVDDTIHFLAKYEKSVKGGVQILIMIIFL